MWMDNWVLGKPAELWPQLRNSQGEPCPYLFRVFESRRACVVLARSNRPEREVNLQHCHDLELPILRRRGGGGTVVLGPGCCILTFAFFAKSPFQNDLYFRVINGMWAEAVRRVCGVELHHRGISDLALGERKVAGTSLFRRKRLVVYQGSMLYDADLEGISRCLKHPSREPDYRLQRDHKDFLTNVQRHASNNESLNTADFSVRVEKELSVLLKTSLPEHAAPGW